MLTSDRKLQALLQFGQLVGLDLHLEEMLLQIARSATHMMEADRFSIFLHDPGSGELYTTVALGMGHHTIRMPADSGIAGCCFRSGETIRLDNAHADPRFNRLVESETGYVTRTLLSMPLYNRTGERLGVTQALNKKRGVFNAEDEAFLGVFNNHVAVFIEMAQLKKARIQALEESRQELERLNRAKTKAIHHISHELKTPLTVVQGNVRLLKEGLEKAGETRWERHLEALERNLHRLTEIQRETNEIMRVSQELEADGVLKEMERLRRRVEESGDMPGSVRKQWDAVCAWLNRHVSDSTLRVRRVALRRFLTVLAKKVSGLAAQRRISFGVAGSGGAAVMMNPAILQEVMEGALKNSVENTPDGGRIDLIFGKRDGKIYINVVDYGIGITHEDQQYLFDGLFPARETELYTSKRPYEFGAGGKGLDLLRAKLYAERCGFGLSLTSRRCAHLPTDRDLCPGDMAVCIHCAERGDSSPCGETCLTFLFPAPAADAQRSARKDRKVAT